MDPQDPDGSDDGGSEVDELEAKVLADLTEVNGEPADVSRRLTVPFSLHTFSAPQPSCVADRAAAAQEAQECQMPALVVLSLHLEAASREKAQLHSFWQGQATPRETDPADSLTMVKSQRHGSVSLPSSCLMHLPNGGRPVAGLGYETGAADEWAAEAAAGVRHPAAGPPGPPVTHPDRRLRREC